MNEARYLLRADDGSRVWVPQSRLAEWSKAQSHDPEIIKAKTEAREQRMQETI